MSRSVAGHRLPNWQFKMAILRKLRLPIYDPQDCPKCWCGKSHDCYGNHAFRCTVVSKKGASNFVRDSWAKALQPLLATAGYTLPSSELETEKPDLVPFEPGTKPLDISL